jgi:hypothetical protein
LAYNPTAAAVNDTVTALQAGATSFGSWNSLPNGSSLIISNTFVNSAGQGNALYFALGIQSTQAYTLAEIGYTISDPFASFTGTFGSQGLTYDGTGIGVNGSTVYTSGNANTPVTAVYVTGISDSSSIGNATLQQAMAAWAPDLPFNVNITYTLNGVTASSQITYVAPEPSTFALLALGAACLWSFPRFSHRGRIS